MPSPVGDKNGDDIGRTEFTIPYRVREIQIVGSEFGR